MEIKRLFFKINRSFQFASSVATVLNVKCQLYNFHDTVLSSILPYPDHSLIFSNYFFPFSKTM